jgi:hypothetical protein
MRIEEKGEHSYAPYQKDTKQILIRLPFSFEQITMKIKENKIVVLSEFGNLCECIQKIACC